MHRYTTVVTSNKLGDKSISIDLMSIKFNNYKYYYKYFSKYPQDYSTN